MNSKAQLRVFAGPQLTGASYQINDAKQNTDQKVGFTAGVGLTSLVEGPLFFAPSLSFSRKGYKVTYDRPGFPPDAKAINNIVSLNTIALSPLAQLNLARTDNLFFLRFGPAVEVALSGKETYQTSDDKTVARSMTFGSTSYCRTTIFGTFQLGFQHRSGLGLFAFYEHGLSSLNNADFGPVIKHRVGGLALEWRKR